MASAPCTGLGQVGTGTGLLNGQCTAETSSSWLVNVQKASGLERGALCLGGEGSFSGSLQGPFSGPALQGPAEDSYLPKSDLRRRFLQVLVMLITCSQSSISNLRHPGMHFICPGDPEVGGAKETPGRLLLGGGPTQSSSFPQCRVSLLR